VIALGLGALLVTVLYLLHGIADALLLVFGGVLLAIALDGLARPISKFFGLPRRWSLVLILVLIPAALIGFGWLAGPQIADQTGQLLEYIPSAIESAKGLVEEIGWLSAMVERLPNSEQLIRSSAGVLGRIPGIFTSVVGAALGAVLIVFIGVFLSFDPAAYIDNALRLVPTDKRERAREIVDGLGEALRWWLLGRLASMGVVGVLTVIGLLIAGIPLALVLGLLAAVLAFVPLLGPIVSAVPAILIALLDSPLRALYAVIVYVVVQSLESYIITPLIQRQAVFLPPALILIAQTLMGVMFGWIGVLLSTPIAVTVIVSVQLLYVEDTLGDSVTALGDHSTATA
jgi:predicted PurR-regulated permease PerM